MELKYGMANEQFEENNGQARLTVIGVGGGGGNAVETMVQSGIKNITFVCANTDKQALDRLTTPNKIQLGILGAGANPEVGRESAESNEQQIRQVVENSDMVFITAGMGGGTGTGAAPVVARIAKELDKLTVAVVTMPFTFEGGKRNKVAKEGIENLSNFVDSIITIPNDKLMSVYGKISMKDAFKKADEVLLQAVQGISNMIRDDGFINIDFNDIKTAMTSRGHAMMGIGKASGEDRAEAAAEKAIKSPLLDNLLLKNAKGLLVNVVASSDFNFDEQERITQKVQSLVDIDEANIFYGVVFDDDLGDEIQVTVVATGLTLDTAPKAPTPNRASFVPDVNSQSRVDAGTHTPALTAGLAQQQATQVAPQQPSVIQPTVTQTAQPQQTVAGSTQPQQRTGNSIQDYLRRQQNK
ncbi:cell division protein FtsZ [Faucicola mancuniensis]|uniref:cell division protein FtsZ n=1 Tax=Faucicola mancuniensis TaxID=1309795 RepID=UPI0028EAD684|nr:cell division protein FtsZ [uncultured Moraxella sp.]